MFLRGRLDRLEKQAGTRDGHCPGCGWRADDVRTILVTSSRPRPDRSIPPMLEVVDDLPEQPGRPRCTVCGGYLPPLAFLERWDDADGSPGASAPAALPEP